MLYLPGFYFVKKPKRFVILSSDKSSERNLSSFFDIKKPRRIEHLQSEELFSSDPYFSTKYIKCTFRKTVLEFEAQFKLFLYTSFEMGGRCAPLWQNCNIIFSLLQIQLLLAIQAQEKVLS